MSMIKTLDGKVLRKYLREVRDQLEEWINSSYQEAETDYFKERLKLLEGLEELLTYQIPDIVTFNQSTKYYDTINESMKFFKTIYSKYLDELQTAQTNVMNLNTLLTDMFG